MCTYIGVLLLMVVWASTSRAQMKLRAGGLGSGLLLWSAMSIIGLHPGPISQHGYCDEPFDPYPQTWDEYWTEHPECPWGEYPPVADTAEPKSLHEMMDLRKREQEEEERLDEELLQRSMEEDEDRQLRATYYQRTLT